MSFDATNYKKVQVAPQLVAATRNRGFKGWLSTLEVGEGHPTISREKLNLDSARSVISSFNRETGKKIKLTAIQGQPFISIRREY